MYTLHDSVSVIHKPSMNVRNDPVQVKDLTLKYFVLRV